MIATFPSRHRMKALADNFFLLMQSCVACLSLSLIIYLYLLPFILIFHCAHLFIFHNFQPMAHQDESICRQLICIAIQSCAVLTWLSLSSSFMIYFYLVRYFFIVHNCNFASAAGWQTPCCYYHAKLCSAALLTDYLCLLISQFIFNFGDLSLCFMAKWHWQTTCFYGHAKFCSAHLIHNFLLGLQSKRGVVVGGMSGSEIPF